MKNNKGFTLVELLATMAILATLMLIAVPNVIGVVQRNKNKTYIEDAKKLATLAEYKVRSNSNLKPSQSYSYCFYMDYLDKSKELDEPPNGGIYNRYKSYVRVYNYGGTIKYFVQLVEEKNGTTTGVPETYSQKLYQDNTTSLVKTAVTTACTSSSNRYYYDTDEQYSSTKLTSYPNSGTSGSGSGSSSSPYSKY